MGRNLFKAIAIVTSACMCFFFSWCMNTLIMVYFPLSVGEWIENIAAATVIMLLLFAVNFFDKITPNK